MFHHTKILGVVQVDESVWGKLTREDEQKIGRICDEKLGDYYRGFSNEENWKRAIRLSVWPMLESGSWPTTAYTLQSRGVKPLLLDFWRN